VILYRGWYFGSSTFSELVVISVSTPYEGSKSWFRVSRTFRLRAR